MSSYENWNRHRTRRAVFVFAVESIGVLKKMFLDIVLVGAGSTLVLGLVKLVGGSAEGSRGTVAQ